MSRGDVGSSIAASPSLAWFSLLYWSSVLVLCAQYKALGLFRTGKYFDAFWEEQERFPFKILVDDVLAGFAFVRMEAPATYWMSEFFIMRRHRGKGIGRQVAIELFDRFRGTWQVAQDEFNYPSQKFWRKVIAGYTDEQFEETWSSARPRGPMQVFQN